MSEPSPPRRTRMAAERAAVDIARLEREMHDRRRNIFQHHLAETIRLASPLLLDVCRPGELDEAVCRLSPGRRWPNPISTRIPIRGWSSRSAHYGPFMIETIDMDSGERLAVMDRLVLRMTERSAHMIQVVGATLIRTTDDGGSVLLPTVLSPSRCEEIFGAPLAHLISHPAIIGRPYTVVAAVPDLARKRTRVEFAAAPEQWRVPWARDLVPF